MIFLDTRVLSELLRPGPSQQGEASRAAQDGASVCFSAVGAAEVPHGVAILTAGRRRATLDAAIDCALDEGFRGRILPFAREAAGAYAVSAAGRGAGSPHQPLRLHHSRHRPRRWRQHGHSQHRRLRGLPRRAD